jgi:hypothetical protein
VSMASVREPSIQWIPRERFQVGIHTGNVSFVSLVA